MDSCDDGNHFRLSLLDVAGTRVTKEGAAAVMARRPSCNVVMQ